MIATARLLLRPVTPADEADLHALERDPVVMRYLNGGRPTPRHPDPDDVRLYRMPRGTEKEVWAALDRETARFLGWFALGPNDGGVGHLGYRLHQNTWGQGLGFDGAAALVDYGFRTLGLSAIHADTMAVNLGSRRIMEKLGMRHLRSYEEPSDPPIPGSEQGEVEYGVTAAEWFAQR
ncbi:MAG: acetyltransferase family protein [Caulobacter sp.]|nr:acetyltransferase family protein [Caulobacter sp.]